MASSNKMNAKNRKNSGPGAPSSGVPSLHSEKSPLISSRDSNQSSNYDPRRNCLTFDHLTYTVTNKSTGKDLDLLSDVSATLYAGEVCAIMGPSGCGKSTLLNAVSGRTPWNVGHGLGLKGRILYNGQPLTIQQVQSSVGYVFQDDALVATQTVRETVEMSCKLRTTMDADERERKIEHVLKGIGLKVCEHVYVGNDLIKGVSGGQRKRTSTACELVTDPAILFLDEPTSGLDSYSASQLIHELKLLAKELNAVIACTIHQPSSQLFKEFDRVMVMHRGRLIFHGLGNSYLDNVEQERREFARQSSALSTVSTLPAHTSRDSDPLRLTINENLSSLGYPCPPDTNVADWMLEVAQEMDENAIQEAWNLTRSQYDEKRLQAFSSNQVPKPRVRAGLCTQLGCLFVREVNAIRRNYRVLVIRLSTLLFSAFLTVALYYNVSRKKTAPEIVQDIGAGVGASTPGQPEQKRAVEVGQFYVSMMSLGINLLQSAMFGCGMPQLLTFPAERNTFLREFTGRYYLVFSYITAKLFVEVVLNVVHVMILASILEILGFYGLWIWFVIAGWLMASVFTSMALVGAASTSTVTSAIQMSSVFTMLQILFSGLFVPPGNIPVWLAWIRYITGMGFANDLATRVQYNQVNLILEDYASTNGADIVPDGPNKGATVLQVATVHKRVLDQRVSLMAWDHGGLEQTYWYEVGILLTLFVVYRTVALVILRMTSSYAVRN
ncbi:unnamed protein product [Amoebophrya sp. A120]|nr:unnamed protein product [Amoebophrya sp. A120]|eukprot:GSA120T00025038001.1